MKERISSRVAGSAVNDAARPVAQRKSLARTAANAEVPRLFTAASFTELPAYTSINKYRVIGKTLGIKNPFFRAHDARSGATTIIDGKEYMNWASYDYLGLNQCPEVGEAAKRAIDQYGTSVSASRLVAGERGLHRELERKIAEHYETEDAVVFVSGHATNVATIGELMSQSDLIVHDELMHNSALVGTKLSGATTRGFRHNDLDALEQVLAESRRKHDNALIVVEGLYSMDGDYPDLPRLIELKNKYGAWLMVDEAHALGVLGKTGRGAFEHFGIDPRLVDIWMGTLSKTLGGCGGYIAGVAPLIEVLKFKAPGFVYSVGMSAPLAAASLKALEIMHAEPERVARLQANGRRFVEEARRAGLDTMSSAGYSVVPIMVGDGIKAIRLTHRLMERGINALPILYPAVPMKAARLRFFVTSEHTEAQIVETVRILKEEIGKLDSRVINFVDRAISKFGA